MSQIRSSLRGSGSPRVRASGAYHEHTREGGDLDGPITIPVSGRLPIPPGTDPRRDELGGTPHHGPVTVEGNPGTSVIPADQIRAVLGVEGGVAFTVMAQQLDENSPGHDRMSSLTHIRNSDRLLLIVS